MTGEDGRLDPTTHARISSPPPIPQRVREYLSDYPDLIEQLQLALNDVVLKPWLSVPPFEAAIYVLKDGLAGFNTDAKGDLRAAKAAGDAEAIAEAEKKDRAMSYARSSGYGMRDLSELKKYFDENLGALR